MVVQHTGGNKDGGWRGGCWKRTRTEQGGETEECVSNVACSAQSTGQEINGHNPNHHHVLG